MDTNSQKAVVDLEKRLLLPEGFCLALLSEDDWSFVIKMHALFEAAISQLLVHHIGRPELSDIFARLELSNSTTGKLAFAKALGYVEDEERRFVRKWSELRNVLVHDVTNTSFKIAVHLQLLDSVQRRQFLSGFYLEGWFQPDIATPNGLLQAAQDPKAFMFQGALALLMSMSSYFNWADHDRDLEHRKWLERLLTEDDKT